MAYTAPTAAEIKTRFPVFAAVADAIINEMILEAKLVVDESWSEGDYAPALKFLVAHYLALEGFANPAGAPAAGAVSGAIIAESLGDASTTYGNRNGQNSAASRSQYGSTIYGIRFRTLMRANVSTALIF